MNGLAVKVVSVRWLRAALTAIVGLALVGAILIWGGLPAPEKRPLLIVSTVVLLAVSGGLGAAAWRFVFKPLPPGIADISPVSLHPGLRRVFAALVGISGINIVIGGFWDEVWRRQYDVPFGAQVFWRPQLLTYAGFALVLLLALIGVWYLARNAQGSLLQRFRAHPVIGLLVLVGAFLLYALPAEAAWRFIYGENSSGWSLPHLIRGVSFVLVMLLAAALQLSTRPETRWNTITAMRAGDLFLIVAAAFILLVTLQIAVVEWDAGSVVVVDHRPPWLLPAVMLLAAVFTGVLLLRATRLVGVATAAGLLALGMRYGLMRVFNDQAISADPWIVILPPLLALDVWYFLELIDVRKAPKFNSAALMATGGMVLGGFPLINQLFIYPHITINNFPLMVLAGWVGALAGAWLGTRAGDELATEHKQLAGLNHMNRSFHVIPAGGLAVVLAFIATVIMTAAPPS
jgi:hypothetical protein